MKRLSVLAYLDAPHRDMAAPLLAHLDASGLFELTVVADAGRLADLAQHQVVLAATGHGPLEAEEEQALCEHVSGGGGLVALHGTLRAWSGNAGLIELAGGFVPGEPAPVTELAVRVADGHGLTQRLDEEFFVVDRLLPAERVPAGAEKLLSVPWRYTNQAIAFSREAASGRVVYLGLGGTREAYGNRTFQQLVLRSLRHAGGLGDGRRTVGIGLIGYGAIARDHGRQIEEVAGLELRGVADLSQARREEAVRDFESTTAYATTEALIAEPAIDLVVVGTPPNTHAEVVLQALAAGKHVVCEKPFALQLADADRMIALARERDLTLSVYQSRRWDPDFVALRQVVDAGVVGRPFHLESFIGGYGHPCSYWHSHEPISGGTIFDWGSHYFDWTLVLFRERVRCVSAVAQDRVWFDVTNSDHVAVDVRFEDGRQATFVHSDIAAALKPKWYLLAERGAIVGRWRRERLGARGTTGELIEDVLAPADSPAELFVHRPNGEGGVSEEHLALPARVRNGFYRNLADHLLWGEALAVRPEEARRNVAVMEAAARSIAKGGTQVDVADG